MQLIQSLCCGLFVSAGVCLAGAQVPSATLPVTETPPVIDGKLDDAAWAQAAVLDTFQAVNAGDVKARDDVAAATRVLLTRNNAWLFMGFVCSNATMKYLTAQVFDHDGPVMLDDCVEMFFDPGTDGKLYYHYMLNWANAHNERRITAQGGIELGWNTPWRSATARSEKGWTAEVAIPLFVLTSYGDMAKLQMNVTRARNTVVLDQMGAKQSEERDWSSWAKLEKSAHEPQHFGLLKGLEEVKVVTPFLPSIEWAEAGGYEQDGDKQIYKVKVGLRTHTLTGGKINLAIKDEPTSGAAGITKAGIEMEGMASTVLTATVAVASMMQRRAAVELEGDQAGEIVQHYVIRDTSMLTLMGKPLADRNYYTDEEKARIRCEFGMPAEALKGMKMSVREEGGKELAALAEIKPRTLVDVPLKGLAVGKRPLTVILEDRSGKALAEEKIEILKRPPKPGCEVKIDRFNNIILKDGQPFFMFALDLQDISSTNEHYIQAVAQAGYNTLWRCYAIRPWFDWGQKAAEAMVADTRPYLEMARKYKMLLLDWAGNVQPDYEEGRTIKDDIAAARKKFEAQIPDITTTINVLKEHPNLLAYYNVDEPNLCNYDARISTAEWYYQKMNELDGYHPAFLLYARYIPPEKRALQWCEITGYDVYIYPGWGTIYNQMNYMTWMTAELKKRADAEGKVAAMILMTEAIDPGRVPRKLSPAEQRCQTYLALIHGAKGLGYFCATSLFSQSMWDALSQLANEVRALAPALLAEAVPQSVVYQPMALDIQAQKYPEVQVALFKQPQGGYLLLAANSQWYPVEAKIRLEGLAGDKPVQVLFGGKKLMVQDGTFADKIERYGTRAYGIGDVSAAAGSAQASAKEGQRPGIRDRPENMTITVTAKAYPEEGEPIKLLGPEIEAISKRKNIMPNSSLERQATPGIPDWTMPRSFLAFPMAGHPDSVWSADTNRPYQGKYSLRMRCERLEDGQSPNCRGMMGVFYPPTLDRATPFVFSAYMRCKKKGDQVWTRVLGKDSTLPLTEDWQRYVFTGTCGPTTTANGGCQSYMIAPVGGPGAEIWVDALQVEMGTEPTPWAEE